ncbi:alpha-L-fucosidase [bacterium]|nr:alpha-L-fucosidase [bacterium]
MKYIFKTLIYVALAVGVQAQENMAEKTRRMQWFQDAKLGIFIHWGIYSVKGIDESWSFYNNYIPYEAYMDQLKGFTAKHYDPMAWADLIAESGAQYAVLTTKHHDGVALWDTDQSDLNVVKRTPAKRDLVKPFVEALRKKGLKAGLYFSQLDWSHPDYPHHTRQVKRYAPQDDMGRWQRFLKFQKGQLKEITKRFKPDLIWFDGDWDYEAEMWEAAAQRKMLFDINPQVILNSRLNGYGDYGTPENGLPITRPKDEYWELCLTMNDSWGYQPNDRHYKSVHQIIGVLAECLRMGGNLLLDIGPRADGTIPEEQVARLKGLGRWVHKHREAVYGVKAGLPHGHFYGPTALSTDSTLLYLYLPHRPNGPLALKGIKNKINRIWTVGNGTKLKWDVKMKAYWSSVPGVVYIDVPESVLDEEWTVLAVLLDGKVEMQPGKGHVVESN